ncbi:MAG TPA: DUF115 domain-containing protein [Spirochaetota bacterium]|nr:DUF115 domain-containing protein [Spirochaetota bacterium]
MNLVKDIGKKGLPTYKSNGKYLYSSYDPVLEAERYVASLKVLEKVVITCCGIDYVNGALIKSGVDKILSFEPIGFENDFCDFENSSKIVRFEKLLDLKDYIIKNNIINSRIIIWEPLILSNPEIYLSDLKDLKNFIGKKNFSDKSAETFGFLESKNILKNLLNFKKIPFAFRNSDKLPNLAIIAASGFSLKDSVDFIKKIKDCAVIIALPSALPYLQENNIFPDYAIAVDPGYATFYHLSKYKKKITLLTTLSVTPSVFNLKNVESVFFNYGNPIENKLYEKNNVATSLSEGSVIFNAFRIVKETGFENVIPLGMDFGFKDNRSHIFEGLFEKEFTSTSDYFCSVERSLKNIETSKSISFIDDGVKKIKSDFSLQIYYNHFIEENFGLNILLREKTFNVLKNRFEMLNEKEIFDKFSKYKKDNPPLKIGFIKNFNEKRKMIYDFFIKEFRNKNSEFLKILNVDLNNPIHKKSLEKVIGVKL